MSRAIVLVPAVVAVALVIGCGGGGGNPSTSPTVPATREPVETPTPLPATPARTPTAAPAPGSDGLDGERALGHVRALSVDIGLRVAGTPAEQEAAAYIASELRSYGYDVEEQPFDFESEFAREVSLSVTSPEARTITGVAFAGSAAAVASGPLVFVGLGAVEEFPPGGLAGAVALIERGELFFADKIANAVQAGATGAIIYNNAPGLFGGDAGGAVSIPVVAISDDDGQALRELLAAGAVEVSLEVGPTLRGTARNVIARPPEHAGEPCETISGGHYDTTQFGPGANDNASGTAAVLEVARLVQVAGLAGNHCFVLFGAEEIGLLGSAHFVTDLSTVERAAIKGMLNFDVVSDGDHWELLGSPSLVATAAEQAATLGIDVVAAPEPLNAGSDHLSFINNGIPAVFFIRAGGNFLSDVIHTPADTIDIVLPEDIEAIVRLGVALLRALEQAP